MSVQSMTPGLLSSPNLLTRANPHKQSARMANCLGWHQNRQTAAFTIRQLNIRPYQHLLEIGYGSGRMLSEVAMALQIGFIAGIESSIPLYEQAYRRNRAFIRRQLMQLHLGEYIGLPYPNHYFHTIYGSDVIRSWKDPGMECLRLSSLLKTGGKLVILSHGRNAGEAHHTEKLMRNSYAEAGLTNIHTEQYELSSGIYLAVSALKS